MIPPRGVGGPCGSRDRDRQVRAPGLRVRRHRDRAQPAHARSRRRRHHLGGRRVPLRAADDGGRHGRRGVARFRDRDRSPRRHRVPQPRGSLDALRGSRADLRGDRVAARGEVDAAHARALRRADQARAHSGPHPRDQGRRPHGLRVAHAAAGRAIRQARARRRSRSARRARHRGVGRARVEGPRAPAAQPQEVHP